MFNTLKLLTSAFLVFSPGVPHAAVARASSTPDRPHVHDVREAMIADAAAGDFAYVDPDEPTAHGRIMAVWADGPGSAMLVRLMAVKSGWSALRAANPCPTWR